MKEAVENLVEKSLEQFTSIFESTSEITAEASQDLIDSWEDLYQSYINRDWEAQDDDNNESSKAEVDIENGPLFEDWIITRLESDIIFKTMDVLHHDDWHKLHKDKKTLTENLRQVFSLDSIWELFFWLGRRTIQSRDSLRNIKSVQSETGYTFPIILEALRAARLVRKGNRKKGSRNDLTWFPREDTECAKRELLEEKRRNGGGRKKRRKAEIMKDGYWSSPSSSIESTPVRATLKKPWIENGEGGSQEDGVRGEKGEENEQVREVSKVSIPKVVEPSTSFIATKSTKTSTTKPNSAVKLRNQANPSSPLTPELSRKASHNLSFHIHSSSPGYPIATSLTTTATPANKIAASAPSQIVKRREHSNVDKYETLDHNEKRNVSLVRQDVSPVPIYDSDNEGWVGGGAGSDIMSEDESFKLADPFIQKSPGWKMARASNEDLENVLNKEREREGIVVDGLNGDNKRKSSLAHNSAPVAAATREERIETLLPSLQERNSTLSSSSLPRPLSLPWTKNEKIIVNHIEIEERHVSRLRGKSWLDDDTINASMSILKTQSNDSSRFSLQSSLLLAALESGNYCLTWDKSNEVFNRDYTIIPINFDNVHWYLAVIVGLKNVSHVDSTSTPATTTSHYLRQGHPTILTIDTLLGQTDHSKAVSLLQTWIIKRAKAEFNLEIPRSSIKWQHRFVTCQQNGYDCGVFVVKLFEQFLKSPESFLSILLLDSVSGRREMLEKFERMLSTSQEGGRDDEKGGGGVIRRVKECGDGDDGEHNVGNNTGVLDRNRLHGHDVVLDGNHGENAVVNEHHIVSDAVMLITNPSILRISSKLNQNEIGKHHKSEHIQESTNEQSNPLSTSLQQQDQHSHQSTHISSWMKIRLSKLGILQKCYGPDINLLAHSVGQNPEEEEDFVIVLKEQWDYLIASSGLSLLEFTLVSSPSLNTHLNGSASHNSHKRDFETFSMDGSESKERRPSFKLCNPVQEELSSIKIIKTMVVSILNYLDSLIEKATIAVANEKRKHSRMQKMRQAIIEKVLGGDNDDRLGGDESEFRELCLNGLEGEIDRGEERVNAIERMLECIIGENSGVRCTKDEAEGDKYSKGNMQVNENGCGYEYEKWCAVLWGVEKMKRELKEIMNREKLK